MKLTIGILAMQGAFAKHKKALEELKVKTVLVRTEKDLVSCDSLIIPGGESTTIDKQLTFAKLKEPLLQFAKSKPILGTCAGAILMSKKLLCDGGVQPLKLMDIEIKRNAYGRQNDSFEAEVTLSFSNKTPFNAIFIRAPAIESYGPNVEILAKFKEQPILVREGLLFAATFHPELSSDTRIHAYFVETTIQNR